MTIIPVVLAAALFSTQTDARSSTMTVHGSSVVIEGHTYDFDNRVVDIKPHPSSSYIAVYTSSVEGAPSDTPLPDALYIVDVQKQRAHRYAPAMSPASHYPLWSPKGTYAAFLRSDYGPIDIVKTEDLVRYLTDYSGVYRSVTINTGNESSHNPSKGHEFSQWTSDSTLLFNEGCCGDKWETAYDIEKDTYKRIRCLSPYCMVARDGTSPLQVHQRDITIRGDELVPYAVSQQIRVFTYWFYKSCVSSTKRKTLSGHFRMAFDVMPSGVVTNAHLLEWSLYNVASDAIVDCLADAAREMSFHTEDLHSEQHVELVVRAKEH